MPVFLLSDELVFPPPHLASESGLLAVGGDLSVERLLLAYRHGIFPWYGEAEPILWWSPDPRLVLPPERISVSKSLKRVINKATFRVTMDRAFEAVIRSCARVRVETGDPTWIVEEMIGAYCRLHAEGYAHSVEAWYGDELAGGLYGVSLGGAFFGESMFTRRSNASKVALVYLARQLAAWSFRLIDCQVTTEHLVRFGAREVPRHVFLESLEKALTMNTRRGKWKFGELK
ncbi:MAG: leucyl/phenylalanyl-tRNA--protein transferase [Deltaproteobacteria bacterium]|nr:leucyl/phenylalanyl-tRNA--protein transferase [Deltaproteobacteria bacterium]